MVSPGGYTLGFRKELLARLLKMQKEVRELQHDIEFITQAELEFIQDRWLKEGDFELSAVAMGREYGYEIAYDKKLATNARTLSTLLKRENSSMQGTLSYYSSQHKDNRYCAQMALQLDKKTGNAIEYILALAGFSEHVSQDEAIELALTLPVEVEQFYSTPNMEEIYRNEWISDTINIVTIEKLVDNNKISPPGKNLFGYEGKRAEEFTKIDSLKENDYNWEEDASLSLDDKIAILEGEIDDYRKELKIKRKELNKVTYGHAA